MLLKIRSLLRLLLEHSIYLQIPPFEPANVFLDLFPNISAVQVAFKILQSRLQHFRPVLSIHDSLENSLIRVLNGLLDGLDIFGIKELLLSQDLLDALESLQFFHGLLVLLELRMHLIDPIPLHLVLQKQKQILKHNTALLQLPQPLNFLFFQLFNG